MTIVKSLQTDIKVQKNPINELSGKLYSANKS
jgi:hypothetical protein